jgi:hypothetical protein
VHPWKVQVQQDDVGRFTFREWTPPPKVVDGVLAVLNYGEFVVYAAFVQESLNQKGIRRAVLNEQYPWRSKKAP